MSPLAAVVAIVGALLAGGGIAGLINAQTNARRVGASSEAVTVETFSEEWRRITNRLQQDLSDLSAREHECQATLALTLQRMAEMRLEIAAAKESVIMLQGRMDSEHERRELK